MTLYDQILSLPLFQGLSHEDLNDIVAQTKFEFAKYKPGRIIIAENMPCTRLNFLLNGTVVMRSHAIDNSYSVDELLSSPVLFEPERLFGLTQYYSHTFTAMNECSLLVLTKEEVMKLTDKHTIFRINLMNRLATDTQKLNKIKWETRPGMRVDRVLKFFVNHCYYPAGHKVFNIMMQQLADEVGESRLNVSRLLNYWNDKELIELSRGRIDIPKLEVLINAKDNI